MNQETNPRYQLLGTRMQLPQKEICFSVMHTQTEQVIDIPGQILFYQSQILQEFSSDDIRHIAVAVMNQEVAKERAKKLVAKQ